MSAPVYLKSYVQDIRQDVRVRSCGGLMFTGDALADTITVSMYDGADAYPISGTVVCNCIRADGATVPVAGSVSGNVAQATLTQACCAVQGPLTVVMKVTNGGVTSTILKAVYTVDVGETGTVVDPGTIIPNVAALIAAIEEAVGSIPADYSALLATIAPDYPDLTFPVKAGTPCWYNGALYKARTYIDSSETWTALHWQSVVLGTDIAGAIDKYSSPFETTNEYYTSGIKKIGILDKSVADYQYYRVRALQKNTTYHLFLSIQGSNDGVNWDNAFDSINVPYDADAEYPRVETLYSTNGKFFVVVDWDYVSSSALSNSSLDALLKNDIVDKTLVDALDDISTAKGNITSIQTAITGIGSDITALQTNEQMYNTPFSVAIPAADFAQMGGIVGVNIYKRGYMTYKHYQLSRVTHNSTWYAYIQLKGTNLDDNTGWTLIDSFEVRAADAPNPQPATEILYSKYNRASITIVWALMGNSFDLTNKDYRLKNTVINMPLTATQERLDTISRMNAFELADQVDSATNVIIVDWTIEEEGNGKYQTISNAYAAITDSAFDNQYEIIVLPGTYPENNLQPPVYTHTHGVYPGQSIVDSTGLYNEAHKNESVFDQRNGPSKLSNLVIKSQTKYCVHQDVGLSKAEIVNENLTCIRLAGGNPDNNACIGIGADMGGAKFIWRNCTFVDGPVDAHTNPNDDFGANQHLIYENCTFVNAPIRLLVAGKQPEDGGGSYNTIGEYVCEIKGCKAAIGTGYISLKNGTDDPTGNPPETEFCPWQLIGGGNNMPLRMYAYNGGETADLWANVSMTDKIYVTAAAAITKGQFVTIFGTVADDDTPLSEIAGQAVANAANGAYLPVWRGPIMYLVDNSDGEYGIDNGALSSSATIKVGRVYNKRFYPYY